MSTVVDLRGRHLLKLADFSPEEITLPDRAGGGAQGREEGGPRGAEARRQGDRADLREGLDADALRVRGRRLRPGRPRHLHRAVRLAHGPQGDGEGHRPRARPHVRRDRVPRLRRRTTAEELPQWAGVPIYNGLTDEWHPTQILADFLTFREHIAKPLNEVVFCYLGDARFNMADSYLSAARSSGWTSASPARSRCGRATRSSSCARSIASETGAQITITDDVERSRARRRRPADRRLGLDGRGGRGLGGADRAAKPVPGQRGDDGADRQPRREVHALPARVPQHRHEVGKEIFEKFGLMRSR